MAKGVVAKTSGREWNDPEQGTIMLYSLQLVGDNTWYRAGQNDPAKLGASQGANVSFDITGKGNIVQKSLRVVKGSESVERSPTVSSSSSSKDTYWSDKEARDIKKEANYQNVDIPRMTYAGAQSTAVEVLSLALAQGAVDITAVKKAAKLDTLLSVLDQITLTLFHARLNAPTMSEVLNNTAQESTNGVEQGDPDEE
jgi:hypothetical protein